METHRFLFQKTVTYSRVSKKKTQLKTKKLIWTAHGWNSAFQEAKSALALAAILHHPDPQAEPKLSVDASDFFEQSCHNGMRIYGDPSLSFPENCHLLSNATPLSIASCWPFTVPSNISATFWKATRSPYTWTSLDG